MSDPGGRMQADDRLEYRDAILRAVHFSAEQFLRTTPNAAAIQELLERLGEASGASRAYIFANDSGAESPVVTSQRFEWVAPGVAPQIDNSELQGFALEAGGFSRWVETLGGGEILLGPVAEFPEAEREVLDRQAILSMLVVPIFIGDRWWGFIGFDDCAKTRTWSRVEIEALETAAAILSAAFERMQVADELDAARLQLEQRVEARTRELEEANERLRVEIAQRGKVQEQLRLQAMTDPLTGLHNRRGFFTLAEQQLKLAPRLGAGTVLIVVDLDSLKEINDTFGHSEGDRALVDLAELLDTCYRDSDVVARLGGDEFAVLQLVQPGSDEAIQARRLEEELEKLNAREERAYRLSASVGTVRADVEDSRTLEDLLVEADRRMYENKRGRGRAPAARTS